MVEGGDMGRLGGKVRVLLVWMWRCIRWVCVCVCFWGWFAFFFASLLCFSFTVFFMRMKEGRWERGYIVRYICMKGMFIGFDIRLVWHGIEFDICVGTFVLGLFGYELIGRE